MKAHGAWMDADRAALHHPWIASLHGRKDTIFEYKLGQVLRVLKKDTDDGRFNEYFAFEYGKIAESEAKARRRGKR